MYSQTNLLWRWRQLGACKGTTIGSSGCLLTCMAQLLTNHGLGFNPAQLNEVLKLTKNYVDGCLIPDNAPEKLFPDRITFLGRKEPKVMDLALLNREPGEEIILKIDSNSRAGIQRHFVLLKSYDGETVMIADPLGGRVGDFRSWYGEPKDRILAILKYQFKEG